MIVGTFLFFCSLPFPSIVSCFAGKTTVKALMFAMGQIHRQLDISINCQFPPHSALFEMIITDAADFSNRKNGMKSRSGRQMYFAHAKTMIPIVF